MKRAIAVLMLVMMVFCLTSCGGTDKKEDTTCDIAMIVNGKTVEDGSFNQVTWESLSTFAVENELRCSYYTCEESEYDMYMEAVKKAVDDEAKMIVMAGSSFEYAAYDAQRSYPDVNFLLIDGVPHNDEDEYGTESNTVSVIFAEEEAGYLAGYAAVRDGCRKLGFLGGKETPSVKRYGYGFVQGAAAAAEELEAEVEMIYDYADTFEQSEDVQKMAAGWYKDGTEVIFACGGDMNKSVMKAAENNKGKVIGSDVDQSQLSGTVITSAQKNISVAVEDILKTHVSGKFIGGTAFNYAAKNDGVKLDMATSGFTAFTEKQYNKVFKQLVNGKIELKKDTGVDEVSDLTGEWVTIKD